MYNPEAALPLHGRAAGPGLPVSTGDWSFGSLAEASRAGRAAAGPTRRSADLTGFAGRTLAELWTRVQAGAIREGLAGLTALRDDPDLAFCPADEVLAVATLIDCRLARGDLSEALSLADRLSAHLDTPGLAGALAHHAKGDLAWALGEQEAALDHFSTAGERAPGAAPALLPWRAGAALALVRLGQGPQAAALAHEHHTHARASGSDIAIAQALRTLASTDVGGDRMQHLRAARAALSHTRAERLAAQIDTDLAGMLLLWPDHTHDEEALALLRGAESYAAREELWPLQGRVRRLLDRLGETPQRVRSETMSHLTASERRVASLAVSGLTNRQIAEELVVTVKAVEWHLSHVYRKLGIASRTDLATTLR